jgi:hypothetical protein
MRQRGALARVLIVLVATTVLALLGQCTMQGGTMDADGVTLSQSDRATPQQQYERLRERYERKQSSFAEAQQRVSTDEWFWYEYGISPSSGAMAPRALALSGDARSYYLQISASAQLAQSQAGLTQLEPIIEFFEEQGWSHEMQERGEYQTWWTMHALTDDGDLFSARAEPDGRLILSLFHGNYWGNASDLIRAVADRLPAHWGPPTHSVPGDFVHMPPW